MRLLTCTVSAAIAAAAVMSIGPSAVGQDKKPVELRYTTGAPAKTPWVMQLERFEKDVDEETKGQISLATRYFDLRVEIEHGDARAVRTALIHVAPDGAARNRPGADRSLAGRASIVDGHGASRWVPGARVPRREPTRTPRAPTAAGARPGRLRPRHRCAAACPGSRRAAARGRRR